MAAWPDHPQLEVASEAALWDWLAAHHDSQAGAILITWKAADRARYVGRDAVLDALVAYGWIDGRRYTVDAARTAQLITPRKTQVWAQSYKDRAEKLEAEGRMLAPGRASVEAGKANGLWDFMADVDRLEVPEDLGAALADARALWDALAPSYRRNVLRWIKLAKTAPTRAKRITAAAEATRAGEKLPQM
ncbi:MAG: YdeI/OmpD-associated family protein [Pseudomonadota bacterium]